MGFTTDPVRKSFIEVDADSHFSIQNLPYGAFQREDGSASVGVAIGQWILDLTATEAAGMLPRVAQGPVFADGSLNQFAGLGKAACENEVLRLICRGDLAVCKEPGGRVSVSAPIDALS